MDDEKGHCDECGRVRQLYPMHWADGHEERLCANCLQYSIELDSIMERVKEFERLHGIQND